MKIRFHPEARLEVNEAAIWYGERSAQAVSRYRREVRNSLRHISSNPIAVRHYRDDIRIHRLDRFPFALFFFVEEDSVNILALAHDARQPDYWLPRYDTLK